MVKILGIVKLHSSIDVITNSSTELFVTVKGEQEVIKKVIKDILDDFGCSAVEFSVDEHEDYDTEKIIPGQYKISYDYEMNHEPCKMMKKQIIEKLNVVEEHD